MWTVSRLTNFAAATFTLDSADKTRWFRTIRNIVDKDIIESTADEFDQRGTRLMGDEAAAIALLLTPLAILGTDARGLREIGNALKRLRIEGTGKSEIAWALDAVRAEKAVRVVNVLRSQSGKLRPVTWVEIAGEGLTGVAAEIKAAHAMTKVDFARIEVDATAMLRTFVS